MQTSHPELDSDTLSDYMQAYRILQSQGLGSRRDCRDLIQQHHVVFNDALITDPEQDFACADGLCFSVSGEPYRYRAKAYLALNKPVGYECSHQPRDHLSVFSLLPETLLNRGVQCVGRLDQDTTGLLLFSDDGDFIHAHTSPKKQIGKSYQVICKHPFPRELVEKLLAGVQLHDEPSLLQARQCIPLSEQSLQLVINEGKYHQVKRMIAAAGNRVQALHRVAIGSYALPDDLPLGEWKWLETSDLAALKHPSVIPTQS
jgi:16S rRNA pseudouridine516 synthase